MTRDLAEKIVNATIGLALVGAALYLVTINRSEHVSTLFALGFIALGLAGVVLRPPLPERRPKKPRKPPPLPVLLVLLVPLVGCSSGPQLPVTTPVLNISCTWHEGACPRFLDAGLALEAAAPATQTMGSSCDCLIDRSSSEAAAETTGNNVRDNVITPTVRTDVSAVPSPKTSRVERRAREEKTMGTFNIQVTAVGGHGCERTIKDGGEVYGCRNMSCPDCITREYVERLQRTGASVSEAKLTHWPGQPSEVVDDLLTRKRSGSF